MLSANSEAIAHNSKIEEIWFFFIATQFLYTSVLILFHAAKSTRKQRGLHFIEKPTVTSTVSFTGFNRFAAKPYAA